MSWTESDLDRWIGWLMRARDQRYVEARETLLELRNEVGEATITEAHKQKRARYLAKRQRRVQWPGVGLGVHGETCPKAAHTDPTGGYLHAADDDRPYDVDGVKYCGRCHAWVGEQAKR